MTEKEEATPQVTFLRLPLSMVEQSSHFNRGMGREGRTLQDNKAEFLVKTVSPHR